MAEYKNPYAVLGLNSGASIAEASANRVLNLQVYKYISHKKTNYMLHVQVKEAYRRLCKIHHPDLSPQGQKAASELHFKEITAAYTKLSKRKFVSIFIVPSAFIRVS